MDAAAPPSRLAPSIVELQLSRVNGKLSAKKLRIFLVQFACARSTLLLPSNNPSFDWADLGLHTAGTPRPLPRLHDMVKGMRYCLALPAAAFQGNGHMYDLRGVHSVTLRRACYAAAASEQTLKYLSDHPGARLVDACTAVCEAGAPFLDPGFVYAKAANARSVHDDILVGYSRAMSARCRGSPRTLSLSQP